MERVRPDDDIVGRGEDDPSQGQRDDRLTERDRDREDEEEFNPTSRGDEEGELR